MRETTRQLAGGNMSPDSMEAGKTKDSFVVTLNRAL